MSQVARYSLRQWIWQAFLRSALIPLLLVETVLIGVYLLSNLAIRDAQIEHLQQSALEHLSVSAQREVELIDRRLRDVERQAQIFRKAVAHALENPGFQPDELERARHVLSKDGVYHTRSDDGRAASFYANSTPVERQDHEKALRLSQLDPLMRSIEEAGPLISSIYFNTWDSYNRIYPYFETLEQYPHGMVIPDYNFYYLADAKHNPERETVWTDVYLDPAGHGWMMSVIAPVYRGDFLEGVVGLDITLELMLGEIIKWPVPWQGYAMLVSKDNDIMVLPDAGEREFGLRELRTHAYVDAVHQDTSKPEQFSLNGRPEMQPLLQAMANGDGRVQSLMLDGHQHMVAWDVIPQTGWRLLLVVDEDALFQSTRSLAEHFQRIGYLLIAGLVIFYVLFFAWMWARSHRLSNELGSSLDGIARMLQQLGKGDFEPSMQSGRIIELDSIAEAVRHSGLQLQAKEEERSRAQRLLELIMEGTTESLWEVETEARTVKLSHRFARRLDLRANIVSLDEFNRLIHPDDVVRVEQMRQRFFSGMDEAFYAEYRCLGREGRYFWLLARGQAVERDTSGRVLRAAGTHVDISRLKEVQDELRQATLEAQDSSRAKSRFLSSMSHELRTPLNAIQGFAQLIELEIEGKPGSAQEADYAREIINASRHLTALVDDILDLSSIEERRRQLQLEPVEIGALFDSCVEMIQPQLGKQRLQLEVMAVQPPLYVRADARRLCQILLNLLSNAIKYNRPQGRVALGYEMRADGIRLWVEDSGIGLDDEQQKQLFQPFQRLGRESSNIPGTGIGLVLCDELAALMGGSIGFKSEPGRGSRFWVDLPSAAAPAPQRGEEAGVASDA